MTDETRTRFLSAIAKQLPADRVIEVHLFPSNRQGGTESGVAVVALERDTFPSLELTSVDLPVNPGSARVTSATEPLDAVAPADAFDVSAESLEAVGGEHHAVPHLPPSRYTVYSARYRHTLKGLDRGKWEVSVTDEADAPLLTIDAVVRGVQRRSGDADDTIRMSGNEFRAALPALVLLPGS